MVPIKLYQIAVGMGESFEPSILKVINIKAPNIVAPAPNNRPIMEYAKLPSKFGFINIITPTKPTITAKKRRNPTFSEVINGAKIVIKIGNV